MLRHMQRLMYKVARTNREFSWSYIKMMLIWAYLPAIPIAIACTIADYGFENKELAEWIFAIGGFGYVTVTFVVGYFFPPKEEIIE